MRQTLLFSIAVILAACDTDFSPKGQYEQRLIVYSILSNRSDSQYVRIYTTYNLSGYDQGEQSSDTQVRGADVQLSDVLGNYELTETTIPRDDKSRYSSDIVAYMISPCRIQPGRQYSLAITSSAGNASATATVPTNGVIYFRNPSVLRNPDVFNEDIVASAQVSPLARGYLVRFFIDVDVYVGQELVRKRLEVPSGILQNQYQYPILNRRPPEPIQLFNIYFSLDVYKMFRKALVKQYGGFSLQGAMLVLTQVDKNLYNYYGVANGFQDPYSVREDLPDYTNIDGGFGVFGAMIEDTTMIDVH